MADSPPLLEARAVCRNGPNSRPLLDGVSLRLAAGDRVGIVGPTGAGKSLLLRALARLDPIDAGEILWQGQPIHGWDVPKFRARVTYLRQQPALLSGTVEDNLRLPFSLRVHGDRVFDHQRVAKWLTEVGRDESFLAKSGGELSGGEAQLAAMLRALQLDPQVLLFDEPTAALDAAAAQSIEQLISAWIEKWPDERAYILVSHDAQQAERMCNSIARLSQGRLEVPTTAGAM